MDLLASPRSTDRQAFGFRQRATRARCEAYSWPPRGRSDPEGEPRLVRSVHGLAPVALASRWHRAGAAPALNNPNFPPPGAALRRLALRAGQRPSRISVVSSLGVTARLGQASPGIAGLDPSAIGAGGALPAPPARLS